MIRRGVAIPILAGAVGAAVTVALAAAFQMTPAQGGKLAGIVGGTAVAAGLIGIACLHWLRRRSIGVQAAVAALTSVGAVAAGAAVAANAMFLTAHDLHALAVILAASLTVGVLVSLLLARRVESAGRALGEATRRIGEGDLGMPVEAPPTREFAELARELDEMSRRLDEARRRERTLDASRRELVAWVSHDLRTPLAGIRAMVEALEDEVVRDPESVARYYRALRTETDRLSGLVDDLFELSRIQAGALRLELKRVSLREVVSDALAASALVARARGVHLEGRLNGQDPELRLSTAEVSRALRNLLENAVRHTPSDGSVWVEAGVADDWAYVEVADECGGIPEEDLERVFDPSFRGEAARTPGEDGGTGLGLAIARGIVEAHHGEISVRNQIPGCRFTVRLPISRVG